MILSTFSAFIALTFLYQLSLSTVYENRIPRYCQHVNCHFEQ
nr:MAG TPA: hypothetical protein [Caudoviricetes sp.]